MLDHLSPVAERAWERLEQLGRITDQPPGLTRTFLSPASKSAAIRIMEWMREAGLRVSHDVVGNIRGCHDVPDSGCPPLLIGSHLDTVVDAGKFDGALGVIVALAAMELRTTENALPPFPLQIFGFSDEEGIRFQTAYLGSRMCVETLDAETLARKDRDGRTLGDVIASEGWHEGAEEIRVQTGDAAAYLEVHIEQGRVLEEAGGALGVVPSICGQTRVRVTMSGRAEHAGTTPMSMRTDALAGAAECVLAIEKIARSRVPLVATVGKMDVVPGGSNTVPGRAEFSIDLRHPEDTARKEAENTIRSLCVNIAAERSLGFEWEVVQTSAAVECDPSLTRILETSIGGDDVIPRIPSGAGHDAVILSRILPVGMMFVRCRGGISHHPDESITKADLAAAIAATARFLKLWESGGRACG